MDDIEIRVELARLDERQKALAKEIVRSDVSSAKALELASSELARRLDILNGSHEQAIRVQSTYVPREMWERDKKESDIRIGKMETYNANLQGRLWLPMMVVAALAAALTTAIVHFLFPAK